ncbi:uncharacterized protein LOC120648664 [Panicum virgatum]|uniref:Uncharacterized protein n=1 Tax=Panicum virgatum TaxID=38727 RepID=A0A8T0NQ09_PANVG|nr:uncharacterized protein LOC120648664 [Panicum virgatum]KAG2549296.1 hypothetical protein PVAP13_9KG262700 [Panicum virgatum]
MCEAPRLCCGAGDAAAADVDIDVVNTGGCRRIPARSSVLFLFPHTQASTSPVLATILKRCLHNDRESGKAGRSVVRVRGITNNAAAAFVSLLDPGNYHVLLRPCNLIHCSRRRSCRCRGAELVWTGWRPPAHQRRCRVGRPADEADPGLVDYMLRMSYYDSATKLAETSGIERER